MISDNDIKISQLFWGTENGEEVYLFKLTNSSGAYVELTNYGATLVSAVVPNANGTNGNVVLGFNSLVAYLDDDCYIGSTIGHYANRIACGEFKLDDHTYQIDINDGKNANHGGVHGFNKRVFKYITTEQGISFLLISPDGDGGFPGKLHFRVNYSWTDLNELVIGYEAMSEHKTVVNFTNHAYFNLKNGGDILGHELAVYAERFLDTTVEFIPTGIIQPTGDMGLGGGAIRNKLTVDNGRLIGLNVCYLLDNKEKKELGLAATLTEKSSGRKLEVYTTYPSIMVYTGDYLKSVCPGHNLYCYGPFNGLCLECQYYPDSPNHDKFPSTILYAGSLCKELIIYQFSSS